MKRIKKKDAKEFENHISNLCNAFSCGSDDQEYRTIWKFNHNKGFTITLHKNDQNLVYSVYGKFNKPHPEITGSNQFNGKYNFHFIGDLQDAKIRFEDHFKTMLNMK